VVKSLDDVAATAAIVRAAALMMLNGRILFFIGIAWFG
jgi:hypothetical protein